MYIKNIKIKNYQKHENLEVSFTEGDNSIVGATNVGKTAIKRALECVLYNEHSTVDYIREGAKSFKITVELSSGTKITRERGTRINRYILEKDGEETIFSNFGKAVPAEIIEAHNMPKTMIGKRQESLFSAKQLDGPFFLQNTQEERASIISSIAKTEIIDEASSLALSKARESKRIQKTLMSDINKNEERISEYSFLDDVKPMLDEINEVSNNLEKLSETCKQSEECFEKLTKLKEDRAAKITLLEIYKDIESHLEEVVRLEKADRNIQKLIKDLEDRDYLVEDKEKALHNISTLVNIDEVKRKFEILEIKFDALKKLEQIAIELNKISRKEQAERIKLAKTTGVPEDALKILELEERMIKYNRLSSDMEEYKTLKERKDKGVKYIEDKKNEIEEAINRYEKALEELGFCPLCFTETKKTNIKEHFNMI